MIQADTLAQAQAQLLQVGAAHQLGAVAARSRSAPWKSGRPGHWATTTARSRFPSSFECRIEQLVNLLADLTAQPELLATGETATLGGGSEGEDHQCPADVSRLSCRGDWYPKGEVWDGL